jgi:DNA-binding response OmpR family regulator
MITNNLPGPLAGLAVFVAEDDFYVLEMIEVMLADLGCAVADSVSSVRTALQRAAATEAQVALLDVNLCGEVIFPVARILRERGIPILFSTGYAGEGLEAEWRACPFIQKPFAFEELEAALTQLVPQIVQRPR